MQCLILWGGNLCALAGVALCLISGVLRLLGFYALPLMDTGTLFLLGIGLMLVGSLSLQWRILARLAEQPQP